MNPRIKLIQLSDQDLAEWRETVEAALADRPAESVDYFLERLPLCWQHDPAGLVPKGL